MSARNLWGDIPSATSLRTPTTVLREQADLLTTLTKGVLKGVVETLPFRGSLTSTLLIEAPALDNYHHQVLRAEYGTSLYPVAVDRGDSDAVHYCDDEDAFIAYLGEVLSSPDVHKTIQVLLAQSTATAA